MDEVIKAAILKQISSPDFQRIPWPPPPEGYEWNDGYYHHYVPNEETKKAVEQWEVKNPLEDKDMDFIENFLAEN